MRGLLCWHDVGVEAASESIRAFWNSYTVRGGSPGPGEAGKVSVAGSTMWGCRRSLGTALPCALCYTDVVASVYQASAAGLNSLVWNTVILQLLSGWCVGVHWVEEDMFVPQNAVVGCPSLLLFHGL